jgi:hypothetical protein
LSKKIGIFPRSDKADFASWEDFTDKAEFSVKNPNPTDGRSQEIPGERGASAP